MLCGHKIRELVCEYEAETTVYTRFIVYNCLRGVIEGFELDIPHIIVSRNPRNFRSPRASAIMGFIKVCLIPI